jgi:flagellar basal body-associated protein FliL
MIVTVILIVLLVVPIVAWVVFRWWPSQRQHPKAQSSGPKHRWWQP